GMFRGMIFQLSRALPWRRKQKWRTIIALLLIAGFFYIFIAQYSSISSMEISSHLKIAEVTTIMTNSTNKSIIKNRDFVHGTLRENIKKDLFYSHKNNDIDKTLYKMLPLIDTTYYSKEKISEIMKQKYSNIPLQYLEKSTFSLEKNQSCGKYPDLFDLSYNNINWQYFKTKNGSYFYLFSAFYDNRTLHNNKPVVRVLSMINTLKPYIKPHCQFWFKGIKLPVITKVSTAYYIWKESWGNYKEQILQPYLLTCDIPKVYKKMIPESISLVENSCDNATTNIRVINNQPTSGIKKDIAVCVKGLDILRVDLSARLVEWLELLNLQGVNKVIMYELAVHPNVSKVLKYYQATGFVDLIPLTLPGNQANLEDLRHRYLKEKAVFKRQNELIPYNDCFYRNMNLYKYISLLDTDEIIMPRKNITTWIQLIDILKLMSNTTKSYSSYIFRHVYAMSSMTEVKGYNPDIPIYMHMLRNVYHAHNYTKPRAYIKAFHNTERILTLHNHFPFACIGGECSGYEVNTDIAHLIHYREDCVGELKKNCSQFKNVTVRDEDIWKYKNGLMKSTFKVLFSLGFFDYTIDMPFKVLWDLGFFNSKLEIPIT
ncbi:unnamed protein product, partial [Meganyctiphanes norvegica]